MQYLCKSGYLVLHCPGLPGAQWPTLAEGALATCAFLLAAGLPPGVSSQQRTVLHAALPEVGRAARHAHSALDALAWLLGEAGDGAATRLRSV